MKKNNKGFSLVEMIVAFAIAALAGVSAYGMMSVSNNMFRKTSNDIGLQYEHQIVVNQVRDYILESSNAIYYDEAAKSLYVFNQERKTTPSGEDTVTKNKYIISKLTYVAEGDVNPDTGVTESVGKIYANSKDDFEFDSFPEPESYLEDEEFKSLGEEFGTNVKDVVYDLSEVPEGRVTFEIFFEENGKVISSKQVVTLRNKVVESNKLNKVFEITTQNEVESFIEYIGIKRDGGSELTGGTDPKNIGLVAGSSVKVKYHALVHAKRASQRKYDVDWSVEGVKINDDNTESEPFAISSAIVELSVPETNANEVTLTIKEEPVNDSQPYSYLLLKATSKDEPDKYCMIRLDVDGNGNYPKSAKLEFDEATNVQRENGYSIYSFVPTIFYETFYQNTDKNFIRGTDALNEIGEWKVECYKNGVKLDKLPEGKDSGFKSAIDPNTGKLTLTEEANNTEIWVSFKCKELNKDAEEVWSEPIIKFTPTDIKPYNVGLKMSIACNQYVDRNSFVVPIISWAGSETLKDRVKYYWKLVPFDDSDSAKWGAKTNANFDSMVSVKQGGEYSSEPQKKNVDFANVAGVDSSNWYITDYSDRDILIKLDEWLDWSANYKIRICCFAVTETKDSNNQYSVTNTSKVYDGQGVHALSTEIVPVDFVVTAPKVKINITKADGIPSFDSTYHFKPSSSDIIKCTDTDHPDQRAYNVSWFGVFGGTPSQGDNGDNRYTPVLDFASSTPNVNDYMKLDNCGADKWKRGFDGNHLRYYFSIDTRKYTKVSNQSTNWQEKTVGTVYDQFKPYKLGFSLSYHDRRNVGGLNCDYDAESNVIEYTIEYEPVANDTTSN